MAQLLDDVAYLSQEIGPRPAGTEEEQQAALYITDRIKKDTKLRADIEDTTCISNPEMMTYIYFGAAFVGVLLGLISSATAILGFIVSLLAVALFVLEEILDKPFVSKLLARDISQNLVTKYRPEAAQKSGSRRKIILVANYDSSKVMREMTPTLVGVMGPVLLASHVALFASPICILFKGIILSQSAGFLGALFLLLCIIDLILLALPVVRSLIHQLSTYNEAANNNAASVAVMLEVMRRISDADENLVAPVDDDDEEMDAEEDGLSDEDEPPVIHGARAAREAGVFIEGAEIVYDRDALEEKERQDRAAVMAAQESSEPEQVSDESDVDEAPEEDSAAMAAAKEAAKKAQKEAAAEAAAFRELSGMPEEEYEEQSEAERLLAAKAAIAGLTGKKIDNHIYDAEIAETLNKPRRSSNDLSDEEIANQRKSMREALGGTGAAEEDVQASATPAGGVDTAASQVEPVSRIQDDKDVPAWYANARAKANRQPKSNKIHRSRYADALDSAVAESSMFFKAANKLVDEETENRLRNKRQVIAEVEPPSSFSRGQRSAAPAVQTWPIAEEPAVYSAPAPEPAVEVVPVSEPEAEIVPDPVIEFAPVVDIPAPRPMVEPRFEPEPEPEQQPGLAFVPEPIEEPLSESYPMDEIVADSTPIEETVQREPDTQPVIELKPEQDLPPVIELQPESVVEPQPEFVPASADPNSTAVLDPVPDFNFPPRADEAQDVDMVHQPSLFTDAQLQATLREELPNVSVEGGRAHIVLPDVNTMSSLTKTGKQNAPLATAAEANGQAAAKSLLNHRVPKINSNDLSGNLGAPVSAPAPVSAAGKRSNLMANLPSLSGSITAMPNLKSEKAIGESGSTSVVGTTGAFAPVTQESLFNITPEGEELYIEDADDSVYEERVTETGAFAGPDYVKMPKSRLGGFFGRFGRKKKDRPIETSTNEWLDVDDDFDARTVGKERGDWSSFRDESSEYYASKDGNDTYRDDNWRGGAYSARRSTSRGRTLVDDTDPTEANDVIPLEPSYDEGGTSRESSNQEKSGVAGRAAAMAGGLFSRVGGLKDKVANRGGSDEKAGDDRSSRTSRSSRANSSRPARKKASNEELRQVQRFQSADLVDTEVWFVALGGGMSNNGGIKSFMEEHAEEMHGAIIVNLESLGAGRLCSIDKEGILKQRKPSTRLRRFLRNAAQLSGVSCGQNKILWRESPSTYAMSKGVQAVTIAGMEGEMPALYGQADDVLENIDEQTLRDNVDYLMALLKTV